MGSQGIFCVNGLSFSCAKAVRSYPAQKASPLPARMITWTSSLSLASLTALDKRQGSSDWNKDLDELTDKQLEYAANDVIYLHKVKRELENMLVREKRTEIFKKCSTFLDTRVELDQKGFKEDIFEH